MFLDFYVAALCNLGFTICSSYIEQVRPPPPYNVRYNTVHIKPIFKSLVKMSDVKTNSVEF